MKINKESKEIFIIILASIILALAVSFNNQSILQETILIFLIILSSNVLVKKITGYIFEVNVKTRFWGLYYYGLRKDSHFKSPIPMAWLPLALTLISNGIIWWLAILEFDVEAKTERVSRRHGLYRFTEVTEWHIGLIAIMGIITNLILAIIGYVAGFELFTKLSIYYVAWSIIPLSSLDGSKIFFASRGLWITFLTIIIIFFSLSIPI
tara:strand:+ start:16601 stop:17227 length:627 start_codon:yes stop_codon:yes gene_type:complete